MTNINRESIGITVTLKPTKRRGKESKKNTGHYNNLILLVVMYACMLFDLYGKVYSDPLCFVLGSYKSHPSPQVVLMFSA